ncbi:hypothetical protein SERLA73DRAFT_153449 [Serpula lacrymans var. lacrymans S7.3]|uniref:Uncharacterized protein n=1 Tax=Serpula lacrymans var. lacrymans (strain S7.3) TaxID=936435 RepID=F8PZM1_SERL3|nr:hypothetical protein SERLA73DRAFT_153449 [Serpula lacrymans var. lacrymans S7.3]
MVHAIVITFVNGLWTQARLGVLKAPGFSLSAAELVDVEGVVQAESVDARYGHLNDVHDHEGFQVNNDICGLRVTLSKFDKREWVIEYSRKCEDALVPGILKYMVYVHNLIVRAIQPALGGPFLHQSTQKANNLVTSLFKQPVQDFTPTFGRVKIEYKSHREKEVQPTLSEYIEGRIRSGNLTQLGRLLASRRLDVRRKILNRLPEKVQGMFLLCRLHLDSLACKVTPHAVLDALNHLPKGLDEAYDETMKRIYALGEERRLLALKAIILITYVFEPLRTQQFLEAIAFSCDLSEINEDDLVDENHHIGYMCWPGYYRRNKS